MKDKFISLKVSEEFHRSLKIYAASIGMDMKSYIIMLIEKDMNKN